MALRKGAKKMVLRLVRHLLMNEQSGATAIEYGLIAALIAVAAVVVMGQVGTNLSSTFNTVATSL
jgi:pilus assembly protein Flp/PilA